MAGDWSSLPGDILAYISGRLSTDTDVLHIHQVCVHWRASTPPARSAHGSSPLKKTNPIGKYSIHAPNGDQRVLDVGAPAGLPYCCGTPRGWLALMDDDQSPTRLVLWEPVSKAEIPLPCLDSVAQVFLSDNPTTATSDWVAIAFQLRRQGSHECTLLVWRPGDAAWTQLRHGFATRIGSVAFHGGKMYCAEDIRAIRTYDLMTREIKDIDVDGALGRLRASSSDDDWPGTMVASHLVTCNGELLIVLMHVACRRPHAEVEHGRVARAVR